MQPYLLSVLSGLMMTASLPNTDWSALAWVCLVPFFIAVEGRGWKETLRIGYAGGVAFYWSLLYWLTNVTVAGFLVLTLYLALYFPLFGIMMNAVRRKGAVPAWLCAPFIWTALEYMRTYAFTGLPWGLLGATQWRSIPLIQIAAVAGVYGVSFVVALVNAALYEGLIRRGRGRFAPAAAAAMALCICLAFGERRLRAGNGAAGSVRVAVVQGNVPQEEKFGEGYQRQIIRHFFGLTMATLPASPDLIVWPETSVPGYYAFDPLLQSSLASLQQATRTPLLFGSMHASAGAAPEYYNSAFFLDAAGNTAGRYDKMHLVLFGEVIPCKSVFPFLKMVVPYEEDFSPGRGPVIFPLAKGNFAALICFEDIFPDLARASVRRGARFLVNVTNDAWFGRSSQPYQHAALAVFRCVENSVGMVRATNTGLTCFIDPRGRLARVLRDEKGLDTFLAGTLVGDMPLSQTRSLYTHWGNLFSIACTVVAGLMLLRGCFS